MTNVYLSYHCKIYNLEVWKSPPCYSPAVISQKNALAFRLDKSMKRGSDKSMKRGRNITDPKGKINS